MAKYKCPLCGGKLADPPHYSCWSGTYCPACKELFAPEYLHGWHDAVSSQSESGEA